MSEAAACQPAPVLPPNGGESEYNEMLVRTHMGMFLTLMHAEAKKLPESSHATEYRKMLARQRSGRCTPSAPPFMFGKDVHMHAYEQEGVCVVAALLRNMPDSDSITSLVRADDTEVSAFARNLLHYSSLRTNPKKVCVKKTVDCTSAIHLVDNVLKGWHAMHKCCTMSDSQSQPTAAVDVASYHKLTWPKREELAKNEAFAHAPPTDLDTVLALSVRTGSDILAVRFTNTHHHRFTFPLEMNAKGELQEALKLEKDKPAKYCLQAVIAERGEGSRACYVREHKRMWHMNKLIPSDSTDEVQQLACGRSTKERVVALYYQRVHK